MGCCMCKKVLKIVAGLALIATSLYVIRVDPWLIVGLYLALRGIMPMVCKCEGACCSMDTKKKK